MTNFIKQNKIAIIGYFISMAVIVTALFYGDSYIQKLEQSMEEEYTAKYETKIEELTHREERKLEDLKEDVLDRLKRCESGDLTIEDAPIILDANHEISIGLFMFQRDTIIYYYEKFYGEIVSRKEAVEIAISSRARDLAKKIIFEETGGIYNWANCARKEGLVPEITVIKKLQ